MKSEELSKHLWAALPAAGSLQTGGGAVGVVSYWAGRKVGIFSATKNWGETSVIYNLKRITADKIFQGVPGCHKG